VSYGPATPPTLPVPYRHFNDYRSETQIPGNGTLNGDGITAGTSKAGSIGPGSKVRRDSWSASSCPAGGSSIRRWVSV